MQQKWENGAKGGRIKEIIDSNFEELYLRVGEMENRIIIPFSESDWRGDTYFIEYSKYKKRSPCVDLYINNGSGYSSVYGGYEVSDEGIRLQSDIAYNGKVVIR